MWVVVYNEPLLRGVGFDFRIQNFVWMAKKLIFDSLPLGVRIEFFFFQLKYLMKRKYIVDEFEMDFLFWDLVILLQWDQKTPVLHSERIMLKSLMPLSRCSVWLERKGEMRWFQTGNMILNHFLENQDLFFNRFYFNHAEFLEIFISIFFLLHSLIPW